MIRTFTKVTPFFGGIDPGALRGISRQLERVLSHQHTQEESMATLQEAIDRLAQDFTAHKAETAQLLTGVQSAVAFIQGVPAMVRKAVDDALAANPGADLTPLTQMAADLEAEQPQLDAAQLALNGALTAAQTPVQTPTGTGTTEPAPAPTPVDTTGTTSSGGTVDAGTTGTSGTEAVAGDGPQGTAELE